MTGAHYLAELRAHLSGRVSPQELEKLMGYYEEYFNEAGPQREAEVVAELGSPEELARRIMGDAAPQAEQPQYDRYTPPTGDYRSYPPPSGPPQRRWSAGKIILAICLSPIVIPLILAVGGVVLGLAAAVFALVLGVGLGGVICIAAGIAAAVCGVSVLFSAGITTTMFFVGAGLLCAGVGLLMVAGMIALAWVCIKGTARLIAGRGARV